MTERRYREGEVRRILELATRPGALERRAPTAADGLTLAEIQSIGVEVGLEPDVVARAAAALDARARPLRRTLGMTIEVRRVVPLPRAMTDHEWDQLVGELRMTFSARGRVIVQGGLREWSNGNLHACVEPAADGYRLRLGTVKGDAAGVNALGATGLIAGAIVFGSMMLSGEPQGALIAPMALGAGGVGAFLTNMLRLPRWSQRREEQFRQIAAKATALTQAEPEP
jgi:hypothetical protein